MRRAHFNTTWSPRFDGTRVCTVTIEVRDLNTFLIVRPFRRRRTYELLLGDVAQIVAERVSKAELLQRPPRRARRAA